MYYVLDENGNIMAASDYKFDSRALYTEEEIIKGYDDRFFFKHETETEEYKLKAAEKQMEKDLSELRYKRVRFLEAFDKWEKAVLRGREEESESIMVWYRDLLDLQEGAFKSLPARIKYYL